MFYFENFRECFWNILHVRAFCLSIMKTLYPWVTGLNPRHLRVASLVRKTLQSFHYDICIPRFWWAWRKSVSYFSVYFFSNCAKYRYFNSFSSVSPIFPPETKYQKSVTTGVKFKAYRKVPDKRARKLNN